MGCDEGTRRAAILHDVRQHRDGGVLSFSVSGPGEIVGVDSDVSSDRIYDVIHEASQRNTVLPPWDVVVDAREQVATIQYASWPHLHFGVVDRQSNYDRIDPLALLEQEHQGTTGPALTITDDEPPEVSEILLAQDQTSVPAELTPTACGRVVQGIVDVTARIHDTFYTDDTLAPFDGDHYTPTTGIQRAWYSIRNAETGQVVQDALWYDMSVIPYQRGFTYNVTADNQEFYDRMPTDGPGAPLALEDIIDKLFDPSRASSNLFGTEAFWHTLTNADGDEGSWNTAVSGLGRYSVTVIAEDFAGLKSSKSEYYFVTQNNQPVDVSDVADAYMQDHPSDHHRAGGMELRN